MQRWEYRVQRINTDADPQELAGSLGISGDDGWELVTVVQVAGVHALAFLKRVAT